MSLLDKDLENTLDNIILFNKLSSIEKENFQWLANIINTGSTKDDMYNTFNVNMIRWYFHLNKHINKENYEMCAKLREVITIEIEDFKESLQERFDDIDIKQEIYIIGVIDSVIKSEFKI